MNMRKVAISLTAAAATILILLGAGCTAQTKTSERPSAPSSASGTPAPAAPAVQNKPEEKAAADNIDVSGEWNYESKISGQPKSWTMTFVGSEVHFAMMAARYSITGNDIAFSVYGGFTYSGKVSSADFMSGTVTQDGKEVGTWSAKRPGASGTEAAAGTQAVTTSESAYVITGNWELESLSMAKEFTTVYLLEGDAASGVFTNGDSSTGRYSTTGNEVKFAFAGGTEYAGTVTDSDHMGGKILYNGSQIGTWSAKKKGDVKYDIRDSWNFTTTSFKPAGSKPITMGIIIGYMKSKSAVLPSMTYGKIADASDGKIMYDYAVDWPSGSVKFTTWDGSITFTGSFVSANTMKGEFKGAGLSSDAGGTWSAERINN